MNHKATKFLLWMSLLIAGCESAYYGAWEKVGVHKRDILVDRIEDARQSQEEGQQQFQDALQQYRSVVNFDGGDLESLYHKLNAEFEESEKAAADINKRIEDVADVAEDLFKEWQEELSLYTDRQLRRESERQLQLTRNRYAKMFAAMQRSEKTVYPVLDRFRDQVLYLKHNLNARAISSLKGELKGIDSDVARLVAEMQRSINEANEFISTLK